MPYLTHIPGFFFSTQLGNSWHNATLDHNEYIIHTNENTNTYLLVALGTPSLYFVTNNNTLGHHSLCHSSHTPNKNIKNITFTKSHTVHPAVSWEPSTDPSQAIGGCAPKTSAIGLQEIWVIVDVIGGLGTKRAGFGTAWKPNM